MSHMDRDLRIYAFSLVVLPSVQIDSPPSWGLSARNPEARGPKRAKRTGFTCGQHMVAAPLAIRRPKQDGHKPRLRHANGILLEPLKEANEVLAYERRGVVVVVLSRDVDSRPRTCGYAARLFIRATARSRSLGRRHCSRTCGAWRRPGPRSGRGGPPRDAATARLDLLPHGLGVTSRIMRAVESADRPIGLHRRPDMCSTSPQRSTRPRRQVQSP